LKKCVAVLVLLALICHSLSFFPLQPVRAQFQTLKPAQMQADFDLMRGAFEEAHGGLYRYSTKAEMDRAFDSERAKLNRDMTTPEFLVILNGTVAQIRCGHTGVDPDADVQKAVSLIPKFPLRIRLEGNRIFVLFNETADNQTVLPGMEILEINGKKAGDVIDRIMPKLSADGDIETGKRYRIQRNFALYYAFLVEQATDFNIKTRDATGRVATSKLQGVLDADRGKVKNSVNQSAAENLQKLEWSQANVALRFLKDPEIAQLKIRGFNGREYPQAIEDSFKTLKEKGTRVLIVDLRGNGGGADMFGAMLVSYLTDKPFRYFDHINLKTISPSFKEFSDWKTDREPQLKEVMQPNPKGGYLVTAKYHAGVAEQPPGKYPFMGKVFFLIDGGTFSTAADACAVTHHLKRATFIGEETGGGYYGNNSGMSTTVTLPNSKARVGVPMFEYWNAVPGYDGKRRGTRPDHVVETRIAELLRGFDQQIDVALKLASVN